MYTVYSVYIVQYTVYIDKSNVDRGNTINFTIDLIYIYLIINLSIYHAHIDSMNIKSSIHSIHIDNGVDPLQYT